MDLSERLDRIINKKGRTKARTKGGKNTSRNKEKSLIVQRLSETIAFSSSDDDFEEPRFIVRSPRSRRTHNETANDTLYNEQFTPRRASDKAKSVRAQSRSRDRTGLKSPNRNRRTARPSPDLDLQFTSHESSPSETAATSNTKNNATETNTVLMTDNFPHTKKAKSLLKTSTKTGSSNPKLPSGKETRSNRLFSEISSSIEPGLRGPHTGPVLAQDTEEDRIPARTDYSGPSEIADSLVPDTEEMQPTNCAPKGSVVPESVVDETESESMERVIIQPRQTGEDLTCVSESLVPDTQEISNKKYSTSSVQTIPDSHVTDSLSAELSRQSGSEVIPDSYVPDSVSSQSGVAAETTIVDFELDTIPDSQEHLNFTTSQSKCQDTTSACPLAGKKKTKKQKSKVQKGSVKLFSELQFTSDSSDAENVETFIETFCVDQSETMYENQSEESNDFNFDTRLLKVLTKNTKQKTKRQKNDSHRKNDNMSKQRDYGGAKATCVKTESSDKGRKNQSAVKENLPNHNRIGQQKPKATKAKTRVNIFEAFDFSSDSGDEEVREDDRSCSIGVSGDSQISNVSQEKTAQVDTTVIDELSQRLSDLMSKRGKKLKKPKKKNRQQTDEDCLTENKQSCSTKNISLQVSMLQNDELEDDVQSDDMGRCTPNALITKDCDVSLQVSVMDENSLEEEPSPPRLRNISLQVSMAGDEEMQVSMAGDEERDEELENPQMKNMSLQVSILENECSDNEEAATSKDLALEISEITDINTTEADSDIRDISNAAQNNSCLTSDNSIHDAQQDSLMTTDRDDTLLSNDSSTHSKEGNNTVFQTPPEEMQQGRVTHNKALNNSNGASPTLTVFKTAKPNVDRTNVETGGHVGKRKSVGMRSSSFCDPPSVSPDAPGEMHVPTMVMSDDEQGDSANVLPPKGKGRSTAVTPRRPQDETGYASMVGVTSPRSVAISRRRLSDSSSDDDQLESFLSKHKAPVAKQKNPESSRSMADFIVDDSDMSDCAVEEDSDELDESVFYIRTDRSLNNKALRPRAQNRVGNFDSDTDSSEDETKERREVFKTPGAVPAFSRPTTVSRPKSVAVTPKRAPLAPYNANTTGHEAYRWSFLRSLAGDTPNVRRHPDSMKYIRDFKKHREELTGRLFKMFNKTVFEEKLPANMNVSWNQRLYKTAGYCVYRKGSSNTETKTAKIELSVKVCDSPERLRNTLLHEMCHAAVWLIFGVNDGHGPYWKHFAEKACKVHPELPPASRCHNYEIFHKYTYRCVKCGYQIGRHSKSLDTKTKVCGHCNGEFELLVNKQDAKGSVSRTPHTPRTPSKFALFVKDNYDSVKKSAQGLKHKDVMAQLGKEFAKTKLT